MLDTQNKINTHSLFIMCDGIANSVFPSQILQPLLDKLEQNPLLETTIVSFEIVRPDSKIIMQRIPAHPRLHLVLYQRPPFFGKISLWFCVHYLKKLLQESPPASTITARGALAGFIIIETLKTVMYQDFHLDVTIQARGLHAQEYRYTLGKAKQSFFKKLVSKWVYNRLEKIEREVYGTLQAPVQDQTQDPKHNHALMLNLSKHHLDYDLTIEAVSPALKQYLIDTFHTNPAKIILATKDIPEKLTPELITQYKKSAREKLNIPESAIVYCYSGSYKPWQCAPETIAYFANEYAKDKNSFLLILSQDTQAFEKACAQHNLPKTAYKIISVRQEQLYEYLSCANFGFLLREEDIINWVSRPTKMLEYQAVGLKIIHNNTIAWLTEDNSKI